MTETETKNISIEHIAKLTKSNDIVTITKTDGNVTIDTSVNKGLDVLKFDNANYDADKFSTTKEGQDLKLIYTDGTTQTITIKNYFSKDGNSTKSSVKEIQIGEDKKSILDYYTNTVSAKSTKINGSMFNDIITGTDKADKISTGAGDDVITAGKGNDTINITGAGEKTINIKDFDGNDVISGIAKADKVKLNFSSVDTTVDYSKSGNNLVATREFYKKLDGTATTDAKSTENAKQMYVDKDGKLTTEAEDNKAITGNLYQSADGKYSITKDDTYTSQVYLDKDGKLTTDAKTGEDNNTAVNKLYEKDTNYTMSETYEHANESITETTTIKDYFKNDKNAGKLDGVTNVAVSGKGKIVGGFTNDTITGSAKNDKMYGLGGNNTYIFNTDAKTSFGNDTVYATGKDTLSFAQGSKLEYTLKGNDVIVSVKGEENANLGQVTIKDALKSEKNVNISVGGNEVKLENAIQQLLKFDQQDAKKGQTMNGTIFNDTFIGSNYNDKISTGAGNDAITAGKGNDTINITGAGEKTITIANGDGNDVITGIAKADKVTLSGLSEGKLSYAKSGNDLIITRIEKDAVPAGEKTEGTPAETATTTIKDYFKDSKNADKLAGVTVKDIAVTGKGKIVGSFGNDVITGSAKADKIYTGAGDDAITAGKGNDTIIIDGAGKKTINIANGDGNDVITGIRTEGASIDLKINENKLSYSKNGASNDLIITRSYTEQLTNKKGDNLYTDVVTGKQTTETTVKGTEATGTFWKKDGNIITEADHTKIGTDAQKGYTEIITKTYQKGEEPAITEEAFGKLSKDEQSGYTEITTKTYKKGDAEAISEAAYKNLATVAQKGYEQVKDNVYSYGSGKNLTYSTDATKANTALTKDYTETTTVKDFFKDGEGASNVTVNGKEIDLNGLTISGQNIMGTKYDDVINGSNKNDVILEQAGNNTFNIGAKGSSEIYSTGETSNDVYNVENLKTSVDIYDDGGKDTLNINVKDLTSENLRYVFDVDKTGAKGDLIITDTKGINSSNINGVAINDYFTTKVTVPDTSKEEEGATTTVDVDHKIENINLNGSSITDNVTTSIANITNDVQNFLNANNYESASDVFDGKDTKAKAELTEIYKSGNNKYDFSTVKDNTEQTVSDKIGDNDIYNVDNKFDFAKDKLVISDFEGENDVLNLAQKADDLTILFNIKKSAGEGESAVGDALYVVGKDSKDLAHGIQMSGIDKVKTSDGKGSYTDVTAPTNEIISAVQGWLASANDGKGYDSVADAIKANDANLADLIAKFAPSQPQA